MRRLAVLAAIAAILAGCGGAEPPLPPEESPPAELPVYGEVGEFELVDQDGKPYGSKDLAGSVWVADFIFTHCSGQCFAMATQMERLQAMPGLERARLVSISVDPERDTPERLAEYARRFEAPAGRWIFLTGEKATLHRLAQEGFRVPVSEVPPAEVKPEIGPFLHSQRFVLVDARGRIRGYYDGTGAEDAGRLERDLRRVAAESKR